MLHYDDYCVRPKMQPFNVNFFSQYLFVFLCICISLCLYLFDNIFLYLINVSGPECSPSTANSLIICSSTSGHVESGELNNRFINTVNTGENMKSELF